MTMRTKTAKGQCNTRNSRGARKLDRAKVLDLHEKGMSDGEIATHQGVARSTVWRFLQQTKPERQALEYFKAHRADVLARLHAKSLDVQERIIDTLDDAVIKALTPSQKTGLLMSLNAQSGTTFDKERLERGKSTMNVSTLGRILGAAFGSAHKHGPIHPQDGAREGALQRKSTAIPHERVTNDE